MMHTIHPIIFTKAGSAPAFDIASLPLTLYLDGSNYAPGTWTGSASAGTSGSHPATTLGTDPTVGTALNGISTVNFVQASGQWLGMAFPLSAFITASAWSFWCLCKPGTIGGIDRGLFGDPGTRLLRLYTRYSVNTFHALQVSSGSGGSADAAYVNGVWQLFQAKYDGSSIWARRDSIAWSGGAIGNITAPLTTNPVVGAWDLESAAWDGQIASMGLSQTTFSDATMDLIKGALNTRFALAL